MNFVRYIIRGVRLVARKLRVCYSKEIYRIEKREMRKRVKLVKKQTEKLSERIGLKRFRKIEIFRNIQSLKEI